MFFFSFLSNIHYNKVMSEKNLMMKIAVTLLQSNDKKLSPHISPSNAQRQ